MIADCFLPQVYGVTDAEAMKRVDEYADRELHFFNAILSNDSHFIRERISGDQRGRTRSVRSARETHFHPVENFRCELSA